VRLHVRVEPVLGAKPRGPGGKSRRTSMFPSTAIKEGQLYVKPATDPKAPWVERHLVRVQRVAVVSCALRWLLCVHGSKGAGVPASGVRAAAKALETI